MITIAFVLTCLCAIAAVLALYAERQAHQHKIDAETASRALKTKIAALDELRDEQLAVKKRLDRLAGRFYREARGDLADPEPQEAPGKDALRRDLLPHRLGELPKPKH